MADKPSGFGSIPGDLFDRLIKYFETTPPLPSTLEPHRLKILVQLARTEHAAANAEKDPYTGDVVFKCISLQSDLDIAVDNSKPDPVRDVAMKNIFGVLASLKTLWV